MKTGGQVRKDASVPSGTAREVPDFRAGFYEARRRIENGKNKIDERNKQEYLDYYEKAAATDKDNSFARGFLAGLKYRFGDYVEEILTPEPVPFVPTKIKHFENKPALWKIKKAKIEKVLDIKLPIHPIIKAPQEGELKGGLIITSPPCEGRTLEIFPDGIYYLTENLTKMYNPEPDRPYHSITRVQRITRVQQKPDLDPAAVEKARNIVLERKPR